MLPEGGTEYSSLYDARAAEPGAYSPFRLWHALVAAMYVRPARAFGLPMPPGLLIVTADPQVSADWGVRQIDDCTEHSIRSAHKVWCFGSRLAHYAKVFEAPIQLTEPKRVVYLVDVDVGPEVVENHAIVHVVALGGALHSPCSNGQDWTVGSVVVYYRTPRAWLFHNVLSRITVGRVV